MTMMWTLVIVIIILLLLISSEAFLGQPFGLLSNKLNSNVTRVVLFSSADCSACQTLKADAWPRIVKAFPNVQFEDIDCVNNKQLCLQYGIYAFPTILLDRNGLLEKYNGAFRYEDLYVAISN